MSQKSHQLVTFIVYCQFVHCQKCSIVNYMVVSKMTLVSWSVIWVVESDVFLYNIDEYQSSKG